MPADHDRLRLLVLASTWPAWPGDGTPAFVYDLTQFEAQHFDTLVLVPRVPGAPEVETVDGMRVRRFGYFPRRWEDLADGAIIENLRGRPSRWLQVPPFLLAEVLAIRRAVQEYCPDVVHVHWIVPQGVAALVVARRLPWLVTTLGGDLYALRDPLSTLLKRAVVCRARAVTTQNSDMRERLLALGADPATTVTLSLGARVGQMRALSAVQRRLPGRVLFVGRLVEKKGVGILLEALRQLPPDRPWSLDVVGDGPLRDPLERQAAGLPVTFCGQQGGEAVARAFGQAEVVAVPSVTAASGDQDGLPLVLLEAMAAGCAIVGSRLPGIDEAIEQEQSGLLVPPSDPDALAGAVGRLLDDAELRNRLGAAAAQRARQYSVEAQSPQIVALLRELATTGRPNAAAAL